MAELTCNKFPNPPFHALNYFYFEYNLSTNDVCCENVFLITLVINDVKF